MSMLPLPDHSTDRDNDRYKPAHRATRATRASRRSDRSGMLRRARTVLAWLLLAASAVGWPLSALTWARHEPQFVLGLSWLAIILTSLDLLSTSQVAEHQHDRAD